MKFHYAYLLIFNFFIHSATIGSTLKGHEDKKTENKTLTSLGTILNEDGTINITSGISGSFDPSGYTMISEEGETPRFAPLLADSDDGWFTTSQSNGADGSIYAVAVSGTDIYVGGGVLQSWWCHGRFYCEMGWDFMVSFGLRCKQQGIFNRGCGN